MMGCPPPLWLSVHRAGQRHRRFVFWMGVRLLIWGKSLRLGALQ